ncbi:MAG TPA: FtsX-like permease family protein, partial [Streptosporangiaceae bacterium]
MRSSRGSFVLRRTLSAPLLPASLLLAILTSVIVTTALASFGARALPAAVHKQLATAPATSILVTGQIGAAAARADLPVIRSSVRSALGAVPFALASARWSDQLTLPNPHGSSQVPLIQAASLDGVMAHAELTAGTWPGPPAPGAPVGVALPASTASLLHLPVGAVLDLHDSITGAPARLRVTGLFRPRDPAAPYWRLSILGTSGKNVQGSFVTYGPMLASPAAFAPGGLPVSVASWLITVHTARLAPGDMARLSGRLDAVISGWQTGQNPGGLEVTTALPQTLSALASSVVVSKSLLLIGSLQLLLLAMAGVALAARLLASQREAETALLSARGAARGQLVLASLAEASLLAVVGIVAGIVLGSYLANLLLSASGLAVARSGGGLPDVVRSGVAGGSWWPAAVIAVLVIIVIMWPALRPATPGAARIRRTRQAALAATARTGLDAALIGLGVLAFWELRRYSAAPRLSGGALGVDPVLAVAPVLALAGIALLPLRALPAAARLLDGLSVRGRRLVTALASWQLSRRAVREGGPVLLVVLAAATGTLVLAQHQSWRQSQLDQAAFSAGADVRVSLAAPLPLGRGGSLARGRGVLTAMPVSAVNSGFGVFAVDASQAARTVLLRPDLSAVPLTALWARITPRYAAPGLALPGRPVRLDVSAMLLPPHGGRLGVMSASLSVQDGGGIVYSLPAGSLPADGRYHDLAVDLATAGQARYPLHLLGLSLSYQLPGFPPSATKHAQQQTASATGTLAIRSLAVSARGSGAFPAPFAGASALARWQAGAQSTDLADPGASGIAPTAAAWQVSGGAAELSFTVGTGHLIARAGATPQPVSGQLRVAAAYSGGVAGTVPAIATRAFLGSAGAHLGRIVPLPVGNATVRIRLVAEVAAFPAAATAGGGGPAVIVDQAWLQDALAGQWQPPLPVTQWWLSTARGGPAGYPAGATVTTRAGTAAGLLSDPLPNVPQLSLLVIVIAAGLLACIGFMVSVVAAVRERRLTDALLAALGMGRAARAGQLCLEQLMLSLPGTAAGVAIGAALAHLLVPAVTLTTGAVAPFPPVHVLIPVGWTIALALSIAAVPVLAATAA